MTPATARVARLSTLPPVERRLLTATEYAALRDAHAPLVEFVPASPEHPERAYHVKCLCGETCLPARSLRVALDNHGAHVAAMETVVVSRKARAARATAEQENLRRAALDAAVEQALMDERADNLSAMAEADGMLPRIGRALRVVR